MSSTDIRAKSCGDSNCFFVASSIAVETPTVASLLAIELPPVVSPPLLWRLQLFQYSTATKKALSELVSHLIHDNSPNPTFNTC